MVSLANRPCTESQANQVGSADASEEYECRFSDSVGVDVEQHPGDDALRGFRPG